MKAIKLNGSGEPSEVLALTDIADLPAPTAGNVNVRMLKRVIHPADYQTIRGFLPAHIFAPGGIPGIDGVGIVEEVAPDLNPAGRIALGMRVIVYHAHQTWAERVTVPATTVMPLPDDIDSAAACQLATNGITALMLLRAAEQAIGTTAGKAPLLVTAAGSSVARSLMQLALLRGHDVVGLVRRDADAADLAGQYDRLAVIGTDRADWQGDVKATAGQAPLVAIDPIGGEMMPALLALLAPGGTLVTYGALDPRPSQVFSGFLTSFELTIRGCSAMGWATRSSQQARADDFGELFNLARRAPHLFDSFREFALADAVDAIAAAEESPRRGAIILSSDM